MRFYLFLLLFLLSILSACTCNYHITVNANKTAHVKLVMVFEGDEDDNLVYNEDEEFTADDSLEMEAYDDTLIDRYNSAQISNLKFNDDHTEIEYDIKNIDSLMRYIDMTDMMIVDANMELKPTKFSFKNEFIKSNGEVDDIVDESILIKLNIDLEFEQEVKKVKTNIEGVNEDNAHTVSIKTSYGALFAENERNHLNIKLSK